MTTEQRLTTVEVDLEAVKQLLVSAANYAESANRGLDRLSNQVEQLTASQNKTQTQLDQLTQKVDQLAERVDAFIFHSQRLATQHAERLISLEGQTQRLEAIAQKLDRDYEAQKSQLQEFRITTGATLERIDRVLDYLMRQSGGEPR